MLSRSLVSDSDPWGPPGSSVPGIPQVRTLGRVAMPSSRGASQIRHGTHVLCFGRGTLHHRAAREARSGAAAPIPTNSFCAQCCGAPALLEGSSCVLGRLRGHPGCGGLWLPEDVDHSLFLAGTILPEVD